MYKEELLIQDGILPTNAPLLSLQKNYYNEYKGIKSSKCKSMNNVRVGSVYNRFQHTSGEWKIKRKKEFERAG